MAGRGYPGWWSGAVRAPVRVAFDSDLAAADSSAADADGGPDAGSFELIVTPNRPRG